VKVLTGVSGHGETAAGPALPGQDGRWEMKITVGVADTVLGTITSTPRGLSFDGPEKEVLGHMAEQYRGQGPGDERVVRRMLERLQGYTWADEVTEGEPGQAAGPGPRPETPRAAVPGAEAGAGGGIRFRPIEVDDSWLDAAG
jgi:hypothetical protein